VLPVSRDGVEFHDPEIVGARVPCIDLNNDLGLSVAIDVADANRSTAVRQTGAVEICLQSMTWDRRQLLPIRGGLLTDKLEVSLYLSTAAFACTLAAIFAIWYGVERTLSIHTIVTTRRELFYWAAILFTFALGTAAGDLATEALGLGFQLGVIAFGALIAVIAFAYYLGAHPVLTFWLAYILTRPLGASLGDLLSQSRNYGGAGLGTIYTSIAFLTVIVALVTWVTFEDERTGKADPVR
jgi:hypothetical protein